jgi:hypothetical protein
MLPVREDRAAALASGICADTPDDQDDVKARAARTFGVTFFEDFAAKTKREESLSFDGLADLVKVTTAATKQELPWLKFARFGTVPNPKTSSGSLRWNGNVLRISGAVGDYDAGEMTPEEAAELLDKAGLDAIIYTSPSHTDAVPRWRVGCPFSAELSPDSHYQMVARLNGVLGGILAPESFTLSQAYFFGSVNSNPSHRVIVVEGTQTLDRADELDEIAIGKPNGGNGHPKTSGSPEADIGDIVAALDVIPNPLPSWDPKNGTWVEWNNIGMAIWRASAGSAEGFAAFDKWSTKWSAKYDPRNPSSAGTIFSGPRPTTSRSAPWCTSRARRSRDGYRRAEVNRTYPKFASTPDAARGWSTSSRTRS